MDGDLIGSATASTDTSVGAADTLEFGSDTSYWMQGQIDDVRVYSTAYSNSTYGPYFFDRCNSAQLPVAGLLVHLPMTSSSLSDSSGNGRNAQTGGSSPYATCSECRVWMRRLLLRQEAHNVRGCSCANADTGAWTWRLRVW